MQLIKNRTLSLTRSMVIIFLFCLISISSMSQESKYIGTEPDITNEQLIQKASVLDFGVNLFKVIYKDGKNTCFALLADKISASFRFRVKTDFQFIS